MIESKRLEEGICFHKAVSCYLICGSCEKEIVDTLSSLLRVYRAAKSLEYTTDRYEWERKLKEAISALEEKGLK